MKNQLVSEYEQSLIILKQFNEAKAANDDAGMQMARKAHQEQDARIEAKGVMFSRLYDKYESAMERGNEFVDWDDVIWDKDVEDFVKGLHECGIEKFVFSSEWSSAVETAWLLQKSGCKLEGLVEINGRNKGFLSDEYEKVHGYLFSVC